jgi:hypothetical protein
VFVVFVLVLGKKNCARRVELRNKLEEIVGGVNEKS